MNNSNDLELLMHPIGKFKIPETYDALSISAWIENIKGLPEKLQKEVTPLSDVQLDTPYRENGWTIRQVVHHLADSHMNSYCRFKLALTEENPAIRPYFEDKWAEQKDGKNAPTEMTLQLLHGLHQRWVYFLEKMNPDDWERKFFHPESQRVYVLKTVLALYSWLCNHHLQHIIQLKKRKNW